MQGPDLVESQFSEYALFLGESHQRQMFHRLRRVFQRGAFVPLWRIQFWPAALKLYSLLEHSFRWANHNFYSDLVLRTKLSSDGLKSKTRCFFNTLRVGLVMSTFRMSAEWVQGVLRGECEGECGEQLEMSQLEMRSIRNELWVLEVNTTTKRCICVVTIQANTI